MKPSARASLLSLLGLLSACNGEAPKADDSVTATDRSVLPEQVLEWRWPADRAANQLAGLDHARNSVPVCRSKAAPFESDSVGPLHVRQSVAEVQAACPASLRLWDWGDEGIPEPVALVRLGDVTVRITFDSTAASSKSYRLYTTDTTARTKADVGPGSTLAELKAAYGAPTLAEAECVPYAWFDRERGISFRLKADEAFTCGDLEARPRKRTLTQAHVEAMFIRVREPVT